MRLPTTEVRIDEHGDETHDSWLLVRANKVSSTSTRLFDSEIPHQEFVAVTVTRCSRRRDLNRDRLHATEVLLEMSMSQAQWGAFVSSFGNGTGVPATLDWLGGQVAHAPAESRFDESHAEVRDAGKHALEQLNQRYANVLAAFENGGKKALRDALTSMGHALDNAPKNMEFAATSLTEHVEAVVTKARADIEGMALSAVERGELAEPVSVLQIESGKAAS